MPADEILDIDWDYFACLEYSARFDSAIASTNFCHAISATFPTRRLFAIRQDILIQRERNFDQFFVRIAARFDAEIIVIPQPAKTKSRSALKASLGPVYQSGSETSIALPAWHRTTWNLLKSNHMKILIASSICADALEKLRDDQDVVCAINGAEAELCAAIPDREVLVFRSGVQINERCLSRAPNLKLLIRAGSGLDNLDWEYARSDAALNWFGFRNQVHKQSPNWRSA